MMKQILFVAVDVLLQAESDRVKAAIAQLRERGVAVIVFGEGDRAELEPIRERLGLVDPFIVECGSAIFTAIDHNPFSSPLGEQDSNYYVHELGCPYVQARAGLRVVANAISHPLKGFGDFTVQQLERMLQLSEDEAHRAKARDFSEPFMTPKSADLDNLKQFAREMGFDVVLKESEVSRFSFLRGATAGLAVAARSLISAYQAELNETDSLKVIGLSGRAEDLAELAIATAADWSGLLVPSGKGDIEADSDLPEGTEIVGNTTDWLDATMALL